MNQISNSLLEELHSLEKRINDEIATSHKKLNFKINKRKIKFEKEQLEKFKEVKKGLISYICGSSLMTVLTVPFIYFLFFPAIFLDISVSIYQLVCFSIYRIPKVKRSDYIVFDRQHLRYLNLIERINCTYCSYINGMIAYVREVGSLTEQYWCPIRHALKVRGQHQRHYNYLPYGDAESYHRKLRSLREVIRQI